jgi:hypothetical protein
MKSLRFFEEGSDDEIDEYELLQNGIDLSDSFIDRYKKPSRTLLLCSLKKSVPVYFWNTRYNINRKLHTQNGLYQSHCKEDLFYCLL